MTTQTTRSRDSLLPVPRAQLLEIGLTDAQVDEALGSAPLHVAFQADREPGAYFDVELVRRKLRALAERNTCLIANHGMIAYGPDLATAVARTEKLETLARQYMLASMLGRPVMLTDDELSVVKNRYKTYGQQKPK